MCFTPNRHCWNEHDYHRIGTRSLRRWLHFSEGISSLLPISQLSPACARRSHWGTVSTLVPVGPQLWRVSAAFAVSLATAFRRKYDHPRSRRIGGAAANQSKARRAPVRTSCPTTPLLTWTLLFSSFFFLILNLTTNMQKWLIIWNGYRSGVSLLKAAIYRSKWEVMTRLIT